MAENGFLAGVQDLVKRLPNNRAADLRRQGDQARDSKNWREASVLYQAYLKSSPDDAAIWVQLGHMEKEGGNLAAAEAAYKEAERLMPKDADLMLQIGHLFKLKGKTTAAASYYEKSLRQELSEAAYEALVQLGKADLADRLADRKSSRTNVCSFLQINDFLFYLRHHQTVSGIQRVQLGIIDYVLNQHANDKDFPIQFVYGELSGTKLWRVANAKMQKIVDYIGQVEVDHDALRDLISDAISTATLIKLRKGDVFFLLGAFWGLGGNIDLIRSLKKQNVKTGIYFYDLIPVTHPEYCDDRLSRDFAQALLEALSFVDFGLAISNYTAKTVTNYVKDNQFPQLPIEAVPLAHNLKANVMEVGPEDVERDWPSSFSNLRDERYVICVGTIEARKNHRYLFDAWKALAAENIDLPYLVLVGRHGWRVDDLYAQFEATDYLGGKIIILHDLSDQDLTLLYRCCMFSVFPSIVEGWGLPIGESLSYGKVCIASYTSSMPEVGGDMVDYIDPLNLRAGIDTLRSYITNPELLAKREATVRQKFNPRDWQTVARSFVEALARLSAAVPAGGRPIYRPSLDAGEIFLPVHAKSFNFDAKANRNRLKQLCLYETWCLPEEFGTWMNGTSANILFEVNAAVGSIVYVFMKICGVPWGQGLTLDIHDKSGKLQSVPSASAQPIVVKVVTKVEADRTVSLSWKVKGTIASQNGDNRLLSFGLIGMGYARKDDYSARMDIHEALTLDYNQVES